MAHVGVERLGAGDGENDGAEDAGGLAGVVPEQTKAMEGVDRRENLGRVEEMPGAEKTEDCEPDEDDRAKDHAYGARALALHEEEAGEDDDGDGNDIVLQGGVEALQAFRRA